VLTDLLRSPCWLERAATAAWVTTCSEEVARAGDALAGVDAHAERLQQQLHQAMDEASATVRIVGYGQGALDPLGLTPALLHRLAQITQVDASTHAIVGHLDGMHADVARQVQLLGEHTAAAEAAASALVERSAAHWTTLAAAVAADGADGRVAAAAHAATAADHAATAQHTLETGLGAVATTVRSGNRTLLVTRWTADSSVPPLFLQLILPRSPPPRGRRVWCTLARASCWLAFGVPLSRWRYGRRQRVRAGGAVRELTPGSWRARICVAPPQSPTASPMATSLSQSMGPTPPSAVLGLAKSRTYAPFRCAWTPSVCVCPPNPLRRRRRRRLRMWRTSRPTPEPDENAVPTPPMPVPAAAPTAKGRGHAATRPPTRFGAHNR